MKAIFGRDIRIGDTIVTDGGFQGKVLRYLFDDSGGKHFELDCGRLCFLSASVVGLLHRPLPEGQTRASVLSRILAESRELTDLARAGVMGRGLKSEVIDRAVDRLHETIEDYKLSPPLEPGHNESLVDRHMTP